MLFALVLHPLICKIRDSFSLSLHAWYLDDGTIIGDTLVVGKVIELIVKDGPSCGLHLNVDKTELLGGPAGVDFNFSSALVMKRVAKTIVLMDSVVSINDPRCELLLLRACAGISKLYFTMRTCSPRVFEMAQCSFDAALRFALERIVTASKPGFGDWQLRLSTLPFAFWGLGVYSAGLPLMMLCIALWQYQMSDHTSDWLRVVLISGLGQTMNSKTYRCVLCYRFGVPLFSAPKSCSTCSKVFTGDIYGDHAVSCAGIIGIKHRYNVVRDTLVDICFRSGISAGKEVDIGLGRGRDKLLRPADMLLYSWDRGLDVCVDLTGSSPLTQTGMVDFVVGCAVTDATHRKRVKCKTKCSDIGYGFLPCSFSSLRELEMDAVALLKRIWKFSVTQDIGARAAAHIFNRISFAIAKRVGLRYDDNDLDLGEGNIKQCKRKIYDGHCTMAVRVLSSSGVKFEDLKTKHSFKLAPSLPHILIHHHHLIASPAVVLNMIKSFPRGTFCGRDGLRAQHLMNSLSGAVVAIFDVNHGSMMTLIIFSTKALIR
ncbi:hypothetical protein Tco_1383596 [Tanacetum coccineum]